VGSPGYVETREHEDAWSFVESELAFAFVLVFVLERPDAPRRREGAMHRRLNRRRFLRGSLIGSATAGFVSLEERRLQRALAGEGAAAGADAALKAPASGPFPTGKIGKLTVSRLIAGGNLLSGWCHQRDLLYVAKLAQAYLTEAKQFDTLALYEQRGVNAIVIDMEQLGIIHKYRQKRGGRIQALVTVRQPWDDWGEPSWDDLQARIDAAIDEGADVLIVHGGYADRLVARGKPEGIDLIGKAISRIREKGFPAGLCSHALEVPQACDRRGIAPDFYLKTFHHDRYWSATPKDRRKPFCVDGPRHLDHNEFHDNIFCIDPDETAAYMKGKPQPWIAFKVLAAGAIPPASAFKYAFENGVDFVTAGMFDFEVLEDVETARKALAGAKERARPWKG
jgi:hypothetical protein